MVNGFPIKLDGSDKPANGTLAHLFFKVGTKKFQELTQLGPRSEPRHLVGIRTSQNKTPSKTLPATAK